MHETILITDSPRPITVGQLIEAQRCESGKYFKGRKKQDPIRLVFYIVVYGEVPQIGTSIHNLRQNRVVPSLRIRLEFEVLHEAANICEIA